MIYNALQIKNGAKVKKNLTHSSLTQPLQFLPAKEKDEDWAAWNMDWLEVQGIEFLRNNSKKLLKNYKLAKGIIDKRDYIIEEDNENKDLIDILTKEDESALELKFYPIIPNVVNVLSGEFSKRYNKIQFRAVDDISYNEMLEQKRGMIEETLLAEAELKMLQKMIEMGDVQEELLSRENLMTLPQIEDYFKKSYRSSIEEWATHQYNVDVERFRMNELEERAFQDMLITDREFWHFKMHENDYDVELWNPVLTFYHKSPDSRYISEGNFVGKLDLMSVADVIDKYGYLMNEEQLASLENVYPQKSALYQVNGYQNDGSYYDATKSHEWNTNSPGLDYRRHVSNWRSGEGDIVSAILNEGEDVNFWGESYLMRVCTTYWKTQRKVGHLIRISEIGEITQDIVDETYKITEKGVYDTSVFKNKTKENLLQGEHIDWIWINEVWGGVKIGPNLPSTWRSNISDNNIAPIYLGINRKMPGKIPFQFKGTNNLYGCKLPVEGRVFSDRNTKSTSLVDLMKPYQIAYNMVNNQIADILVDELGTVIMFDQNALPRHSMGEDWGKGNYAKAYVAMKDFQMLPLDTTITNTENATSFQHYQVLNMEQTNRLLGRIQLSNYFKQQAYETIGINLQRMGTPIARETATGATQALNQSYSQTEIYFSQHADHLMPRVHQMRTDLAQFYQSKNPSIRLSYITSEAEKINFKINGVNLLLRDFNVFATTRTNHKFILDQLKQLALSNNTTGATIFDLGNIIKSESISEITNVLKMAEEKQIEARERQIQVQQELQQQQLQAKIEEDKMKIQFQVDENEKNRQKDILIAEIRSAGYGTGDINKNNISDYRDAMEEIRNTTQYQEQMNLKREQNIMNNGINKEKLNIEKEKINTQKEIANTQLQIARENKNKYDKK
jgi:hypothetical protein